MGHIGTMTFVCKRKEAFPYRIKAATFQTIGKKPGNSGETFVQTLVKREV